MSIIEQDNYILVNNKGEIETNFKKLDESKFGSNSNIYFYNKTDVLKVLNESDSVQKINDLELLKSLKTTSVTTFKKILFINELYYGYSMKYICGKPLYNLKENTDLKLFLVSLREIESDLKILAENKIVVFDLNAFNVLYNDKTNKATLIDCDSYFSDKDYNKDGVLFFNMKHFYSLILRTIANTYNINSSKSLLLKYMNKIIFDQMEYTDGIDIYFKYLISLLENEVDKEIITVKDFRKCLTLTNFDS